MVEAPEAAISSIGSAVESGIGSAAPAMSSIGVGGAFEGHFSPSYLGTLPEHIVDSSSFNMDRVVPVPEMVFNQKLFEVVYQAQEKPANISLPDFLGLPEYRIDPDSFAAKTELTPVSAKLLWEQDDRFPIIFQAPKEEPKQPEAKPAVFFAPAEQTQDEVLIGANQAVAQPEEEKPSVFHTPNTELAQHQANARLVEGIETQLGDQSVWSPEEKTFWETLFQKALSVEVRTEIGDEEETETAVQTQTQTKGKPQTSVETETAAEVEPELLEETEVLAPKVVASTIAAPPEIPTAEGTQPEPVPEDEKEKVKKPVWEVRQRNIVKKIAQNLFKKRHEQGQEINSNAYTKKYDPKTAIESRLIELDYPNLPNMVRVLKGDLEYPQVSLKIMAALQTVEAQPDQTNHVISKVIKDNPPKEKKPEFHLIKVVEEEQLEEPVKSIAQSGAKHIILHVKKGWQMVKRTTRKHPIELDKVERKAA